MLLYTCPACGFITLDQAPGEYGECAHCSWIDDIDQLRDPHNEYGANEISLEQFQISNPLQESDSFAADISWFPFDAIAQKKAARIFQWTDSDHAKLLYWKRKGIAKALPFLTMEEKEIILQSLKICANGDFFSMEEYKTLLGGTREQLQTVIEEWEPEENTFVLSSLLINNCMLNLLFYPHGKEQELVSLSNRKNKEWQKVYTKWKQLKFTAKITV